MTCCIFDMNLLDAGYCITPCGADSFQGVYQDEIFPSFSLSLPHLACKYSIGLKFYAAVYTLND